MVRVNKIARPEFLASVFLFLLDFVQIWGQKHIPREESANDSCDHIIWDTTREPKGVRQVYTTCSEGHIDWKHPYGAVRVTLQLGSRFTDLEACFKAKAHYTVTKISLESFYSQDTQVEDLVPLVMLNNTHSQTKREICLRTKPHQSSPLTLFIEAHSDLSASVIGQVQLEYDIQKLPTSSSQSYDDMDDCRPCTDEELLEAVCSHDFVAHGSIDTVLHDLEAQESEVRIEASRVIRQTETLFQMEQKPKSDEENINQVTKQDKKYKGSVYFPLKCGIHRGEGEFLFIGRVRLGRGLLRCAPRLEDFQEMYKVAEHQGRIMCSVR